LTKAPQYLENPPKTVYHRIVTGENGPIRQKPRRLRKEVAAEVEKEFRNNVKCGLCSVSDSEWATPLVVRRKKGKMRIIGDYRLLNAITERDSYPIPNLQDSTQNLAGKTVFSTIDLVRAFHNIVIHPDDRKKTAIITPNGLYHWNRLPFGMRNGPSSFQRFINTVLGDLPFVFCFIDDVLIYSNNTDKHNEHLKIVFQRLTEYGLTINLEKCSFYVSEAKFLGHTVTKDGFQPNDDRIQYI